MEQVMKQGAGGDSRGTFVTTMCDLLKVLRNNRLTAGEICAETGSHHNTVRRWLREMLVNGIVVKVPGPARGCRGQRAAIYTLSPEWGGRP